MKLIPLLMLVLACCVALPEEEGTLKVLDWNVLLGFNRKKSLSEGVRWIKEQDPDVVALQELNGNSSSSLDRMASRWGHEHSVILKEKGFPVGLTSKRPIEVIERRVEGFHHGYIHCRTWGIHFFVVHFWRGKDHEAAWILKKINRLLAKNERVIVCGDFNTFSRKDSEYLATRKLKKLRYKVVDMFEAEGFVDLVHKHDKSAKFSYPSPLIIPKWAKSMAEVESSRRRIDFILADRILQTRSISGRIVVSPKVETISDHYPVVVELRLPSRKME